MHKVVSSALVFVLVALLCGVAWARFTKSVQGTLNDTTTASSSIDVEVGDTVEVDLAFTGAPGVYLQRKPKEGGGSTWYTIQVLTANDNNGGGGTSVSTAGAEYLYRLSTNATSGESVDYSLQAGRLGR
jgi:hypothetical protein